MNVSPHSNGRRSYQIVMSEVVSDECKKLHRDAVSEGRGPEFLEAFHEIMGRLGVEPLKFGERAFRVPALRIKIRYGMIRPIHVSYGVSEDRLIVYIRTV